MTTADRPADETELRQRHNIIRQMQISQLLAGSRMAASVTLLAIPLMIFFIAGTGRTDSLLTWTGIIVGTSGVHYLLLGHRRTNGFRNLSLARVKISTFVWQLIAGLAWGSIALSMDPGDLSFIQALSLPFAAAVLLSLLTGYSLPSGVTAFTLAVTTPLVILVLTQQKDVYHPTVLAAGLLVVSSLLIACRMQRQALRDIRLRVDNDLLTDSLRELQHKNETLGVEYRNEVMARKGADVLCRQQQAFLAGVLDTELAMVLVMELDGTVRRFNRACEVCTGYAAHEIIGQTIWDTVLHRDQRECFKLQLESVAAGHFPTRGEVQWHSKNRGVRLIRLNTTGILGDDGKCMQIVCTGVDTTERRRVEESLSYIKSHFERLVEGVVDYAIYLLDPSGIIVSWNQGAERISGYRADEAIGVDFSTYFSADTQLSGNFHVELRLAATDGFYRREGWYLKRDGSRFWATLTITPVRDSENVLSGFSVIINDITVRKTTEDTIRALSSITEQLNSSLELDSMMESLVREAIKLVQAESGYAGLLDDGTILSTPYYHPGTRTLPAASFAAGDATIPGYVCRTRRTCVFNDQDNSPRLPGAASGNCQPRNMVCVPIVSNTGKTLGFIEIHNKTGLRDFDTDDCKKLLSAANSAALAIQNAQSFQRIRDAEALLSDETVILEAIARRQPLQRILQTLVDTVEKRCAGVAACIIRREHRGQMAYIVCSPSLDGRINPAPELDQRIDELLHNPDNNASGFVPAPDLGSPAAPLHAVGESTEPGHTHICLIGNNDGEERNILLLLADPVLLNQVRITTVLNKIRHLSHITLERWSSERDLQIRDQAMRSTMNAILLIEHRNPEFPVVYANDAANSLIHPSAGTPTGQSITALLTGVAGKPSFAIENALHYRQHAYTTIERKQADGDSQWIEVYVTPVNSRTREVRHSIAIMNDISERVAARLALEESETRISTMMENIPGMVYQYLDGNPDEAGFIFVSRGAEEIMGIEAQALLGHRTAFSDMIPCAERDGFEQSRAEARESLSTWNWEGPMVFPLNDEQRWVELRSRPREQPDGAIIWDGIIFDNTARKQTELALARSREALRALSDHLQTVREREKAILARELHDELGSMLTTLKIEASSIKSQLQRNPNAACTGADAIVTTVHDAIATVRRISTGLRPPVLDSLGLVPAIEWQLEQFRKRMDTVVDLHVSEGIKIPDGDHSIAIFRILQEGLTNISRHARATRVSIVLVADQHKIALDIIDDGIGFDINIAGTGISYGLYSMQERALALGGRLDIISCPGDGTRLRIRVPVPASGNRSCGV